MMYKKKGLIASAFHFPFDRLVIWGLRSERDTYRYIHFGFWNTAKKIGVPVIWIDNNKINARIIRKNDLILAVDVAGWNLPVVEGAYYCLHNFTLEKINPRYLLHLQVYTSNAVSGANEIDNMTYLNHESRTLFQAWGTDLLPWEFAGYSHVHMRRLSFWVGSVWNNKENQGNIKEINELKEALRERNVFLAISHANNSLARRLIRYSRIAPAVAGSWQVENNYLPCRMFKNVSYGALGLTNVKGFEGIFGDSLLYSSEIEGLVEMGFSMPDKRKRAYVAEQQERVAHHTYANKLKRIIDSFEMLNDG